MRRTALVLMLGVVSVSLATGFVQPPEPAKTQALYPELKVFYEDLHRNPELGYQEVRTAAKLAEKLRALGYEVTTGVGKTGVVAVLKNGKGPTVLLRADMDALPLEEKTGLPYASVATSKDDRGETVKVMHGCGHDVHVTTLVGAAALLAAVKNEWRGTLILVGQPAEEGGGGASAMLKDGFLERFGRPDFALSLHDVPDLPAGSLGVTPGFAHANSDRIDITVYGKGGHGSTPHLTVDPIVIAARIVVALQTIVAREKDPLEPAVVTVGAIRGGTTYNIIPDETTLKLTVRTFKPEVRERIFAAIARIAKAEAAAAGAPKEPLVAVQPGGYPSNYNDPALAKRITAAFEANFGKDKVSAPPPTMAGEDFGEFGRAANAPSLMFWLGATPAPVFAAAGGDPMKLPSLHSPLWAPDPEPTIKTGSAALAFAALELLARP
ncbi:MAG: amidohydrolase [Thermoanaerobaculia bacterium]